MANPKKQVPENVPGDFFVDSTCIDCDACRQIAPSVFGEAAETSFVKAQPVASADRRQALQALLACPTGSIGCLGDDDVKAVMKDFPLVIEEPVYYCGYNSPKSYGGNSYLIRHAEGNWLIDSPKFVTPLVRTAGDLGRHRPHLPDAPRRRGRCRALRRAFWQSPHHPSRRIVVAARCGNRPRRRRAVGIGSRFSCHPHARTHEGPLRPPLPRPIPFHRRPSLVEPGQAATFGFRGLLLVFLAQAGRVDGTAG